MKSDGEIMESGDVVVVCRRSGGSRRPLVCGKSPKDLAFALHQWTRGQIRFLTIADQEQSASSLSPDLSWKRSS